MIRHFISILAMGAFALTGCSSDDHTGHSHAGGAPGSPYPSCDAVIKACHEKDTGPKDIAECHAKAHDGKSDADCAGDKDRCVALCSAAGSDGGMHMGHDSGM